MVIADGTRRRAVRDPMGRQLPVRPSAAALGAGRAPLPERPDRGRLRLGPGERLRGLHAGTYHKWKPAGPARTRHARARLPHLPRLRGPV